VIPTSQSIYNPNETKNQTINQKDFSNYQQNESLTNNSIDRMNQDFDLNNESKMMNNSYKQTNITTTKNDPITSLLVCQITSFEEAKVHKFITNKFDTILDFDFYSQNGLF
jgi:hypothetical protein